MGGSRPEGKQSIQKVRGRVEIQTNVQVGLLRTESVEGQLSWGTLKYQPNVFSVHTVCFDCIVLIEHTSDTQIDKQLLANTTYKTFSSWMYGWWQTEWLLRRAFSYCSRESLQPPALSVTPYGSYYMYTVNKHTYREKHKTLHRLCSRWLFYMSLGYGETSLYKNMLQADAHLSPWLRYLLSHVLRLKDYAAQKLRHREREEKTSSIYSCMSPLLGSHVWHQSIHSREILHSQHAWKQRNKHAQYTVHIKDFKESLIEP